MPAGDFATGAGFRGVMVGIFVKGNHIMAPEENYV